MHPIARLGIAAALAAAPAIAQAESWTLIVQPYPHSQNPPSYSSWSAYRSYGDLQSCLDQRMSLHYELWSSDRDMSMRTLTGVCRSDSTGQIVDRLQYDDADEDWGDEDW